MRITPKGYARADMLMHNGWAPEHPTDPRVKVIDVNEDGLLHEQGRDSSATRMDWRSTDERRACCPRPRTNVLR